MHVLIRFPRAINSALRVSAYTLQTVLSCTDSRPRVSNGSLNGPPEQSYRLTLLTKAHSVGEGRLYLMFATVVLPRGSAACGYLKARPLNVSKGSMQNTKTPTRFVVARSVVFPSSRHRIRSEAPSGIKTKILPQPPFMTAASLPCVGQGELGMEAVPCPLR